MNDWSGADDDAPRMRGRAFWVSFGLLYLIPVGLEAARHDGARRALELGSLAVFVAVYYGAALNRKSWSEPFTPLARTLLGALAALTAVLPFVFGQHWLGLPVYLGIVGALTLPMKAAPAGVAGAMVLAVAQGLLLGAPPQMIAVIALTLLSFGLLMVAFRHSRGLVAELRAARGEAARLAAADERLRIARDLHDLLGHSLSLIVLKSELARRVAERDPGRAAAEVADIERVARRSLAEVREAVSGYRRRGLAEELDGARAVLAAAGVAATVEGAVEGVDGSLPEAADGLFGWAVREGVTNVVRHARATRCAIMVGRDGGAATLEIRDDGRAGPGHAPGNGLTGLAERVAEAGGSVAAGPLPEGGFRLRVEVPLLPAKVESPT
ncbi:sensor histidine kinase [Spirillospora sp. NPDC050679]